MTDSGAGCYNLMCDKQIYNRQDLARYLREKNVLGLDPERSEEAIKVLECWRLNRICDEKVDSRGSRPTQTKPSSSRQSSQAKPPSPRGQSQRTQSSQANPPSPRGQSQQRQSSQANPPSSRGQSQRRQSSQANPPSSRGQSKEIPECVRIAGLPNDELKQALFLASGKKSVYYMHRNDLVANLIKKRIRPNSNELLLPINDNHPPSEAWRLVATYADNIRLAQSRGESFEHSMTLLNQKLEEAKYRHGEELNSNRSKERATARDKTFKAMVEEREAAEAAERKEAERVATEAAERDAVAMEAEAAAAREKQTTARSRIARFTSGVKHGFEMLSNKVRMPGFSRKVSKPSVSVGGKRKRRKQTRKQTRKQRKQTRKGKKKFTQHK